MTSLPNSPDCPEDVSSPFTLQLLAVEKKMSGDHFNDQEWSGRRRGGKQQVLPIGRLGVPSQKGLTKIAYSRSGDPIGNPSLCMGWRRWLVNPLAPELRTSLCTSPSLSEVPQVSARCFLHLPLCFSVGSPLRRLLQGRSKMCLLQFRCRHRNTVSFLTRKRGKFTCAGQKSRD